MAGALDPATLFQGLAGTRGLVLAVSGGPDSTALMHLAAAWRPADQPMWVASVDHGLRDGSRQVAEAVVARAAGLGLAGRVLPWVGEKPRRGIQAHARGARYALLAEFCQAVSATHLVLAHTLDDQVETMLMRLASGSGLRGVGGMRPTAERAGVTLARPLLSVRKDALVDLCARQRWPFVVDPANADSRFARARWRRLAPMLAAEGLTPERLHRFAMRMARADAALDAAAACAARRAVLSSAAGTLAFDATSLMSCPDETLLRVLADALAALCPAAPPRLQRLEHLVAALRAARDEAATLRRTLQGCLVTLDRSDRLILQLEPPRRRGRTVAP